jgi:hypothetical protein
VMDFVYSNARTYKNGTCGIFRPAGT